MYHFGTSVAIDVHVHRMFHHGSTALLRTRASGLLRYTSAGLPHKQLAKMSFDEIFDLTAGVYFNFYNKQGLHRNLRTNPVDPSSPLQKLILSINCFMCTELRRCLVLSPSMRIIQQFPRAEQG